MSQNRNCAGGQYVIGLKSEEEDRGNVAGIRMAENIAITPPSFLGIERRIVYAHKKYHSGLMCVGVDRGLAGMKFSGSRKSEGNAKDVARRISKNIKTPTRSLVV